MQNNGLLEQSVKEQEQFLIDKLAEVYCKRNSNFTNKCTITEQGIVYSFNFDNCIINIDKVQEDGSTTGILSLSVQYDDLEFIKTIKEAILETLEFNKLKLRCNRLAVANNILKNV